MLKVAGRNRLKVADRNKLNFRVRSRLLGAAAWNKKRLMAAVRN